MKLLNNRTLFTCVLGLLFVGLFAVIVCEAFYALFNPNPDFNVSVSAMGETYPLPQHYPRKSTIRVSLTCETPKSFIPRLSIRTAIFVNDTKVETLRWPAGTIYHRSEELGERNYVTIGTIRFMRIPKNLLLDGEHKMVVKSYQRRGGFLFIFGTVKEKTAEYKMIVSDNAITSLDRLDPLED